METARSLPVSADRPWGWSVPFTKVVANGPAAVIAVVGIGFGVMDHHPSSLGNRFVVRGLQMDPVRQQASFIEQLVLSKPFDRIASECASGRLDIDRVLGDMNVTTRPLGSTRGHRRQRFIPQREARMQPDGPAHSTIASSNCLFTSSIAESDSRASWWSAKSSSERRTWRSAGWRLPRAR